MVKKMFILVMVLVLTMTIFLTGCSEDKGAIPPAKKEKPNTMPIEEFNKLLDDQKLKNMGAITDVFGTADKVTQDDKGHTVWVYFDRVHYKSGNIASLLFSFYTEEEYKKFMASMGLSGEYEEGMVAKTEPLTRERLKSLYGIE
ncbi:MAG: hypothetical protein JM58_10090 [Peptococcaceae bacterium BICA1-8]|nr:MAG: hypothetical protein JM58_10090 [Peptococcaceae bacterium BICA1-8]